MFDTTKLEWTRKPESYTITDGKIEIVTKPHTDLWQRTYYHFRNDNAPVLQMKTSEKYFSFTVKTEFENKHRFDQCGVVMYLDSENWLKGSIEYENDEFAHLGSVATNHGYSDWATTAIDASIKSMWYRLSRREDDFCIECSEDGIRFSQMRVCHMWDAVGEIRFGVYACSPEDSSFKATFTHMDLTECKWLAHDGQQPDDEKKIRLITPTIDNKEAALRFRQSFFDAGERTIDGSELLDKKETYEEWLSYVTDNASVESVRDGCVLTDTYFAVDCNDNIVGIIDFRHELNDFFKDFGHSGYSVLPAERRKGYATEMLRLIVEKAKADGLREIQLSALRSNTPSVKTIKNNGGVLVRSFEFHGNIADVFVIRL